MNQSRPAVGVGVYIVNADHLLMGRRINSVGAGTWAPCGGHLERGETFVECAMREAKEETGLIITNVRQGVVTNNITPGNHSVTIHMAAEVERGRLVNWEPNKCEEWMWMPLNALPANLFHPVSLALEAGFDPARLLAE